MLGAGSATVRTGSGDVVVNLNGNEIRLPAETATYRQRSEWWRTADPASDPRSIALPIAVAISS
jgi:hypothetical protein